MDISQNLHKNRSSKSKSHVWSETKVCVLILKNSQTDIFEGKQQQMTIFIRFQGEWDLYIAIFWPLCNPVYLLQTCEYKCFKCAFYFPWDLKFLHQIGFTLNRNTAAVIFVPAWGWGTHGSPSEGDVNQPGCCSAEPNSTDHPPWAHRCCLSTVWPRGTYARPSWKNCLLSGDGVKISRRLGKIGWQPSAEDSRKGSGGNILSVGHLRVSTWHYPGTGHVKTQTILRGRWPDVLIPPHPAFWRRCCYLGPIDSKHRPPSRVWIMDSAGERELHPGIDRPLRRCWREGRDWLLCFFQAERDVLTLF